MIERFSAMNPHNAWQTLRNGLMLRIGAAVVAGALIVTLAPGGAQASEVVTELISTTGSSAGNASSAAPAISADGRFVAFSSAASDLVADDTNGVADVFIYDRRARRMERVSLSPAGEQLAVRSASPSISGDGRFVAFTVAASPSPLSPARAIFLRDRTAGTTTEISRAPGGGPALNGQGDPAEFGAPFVARDGSAVAFDSNAVNLDAADGPMDTARSVYVRTLETQQTRRVSRPYNGAVADGDSYAPALSADGTVVGFYSSASNIVLGDTNGNRFDVFVRDLTTGANEVVTIDGQQHWREGENPLTVGLVEKFRLSLSGDGRYVAFTSGVTTLAPGDKNNVFDVFLRDRVARTTERASITWTQREAAFESLVPTVSDGGRYVSFMSQSDTLGYDTDSNAAIDVFVRDRQDRLTARVSLTPAGGEPNGASTAPAMLPDGSAVAFASAARNLSPNDTNTSDDVYVRGPSLPPLPPAPSISAPGPGEVLRTTAVTVAGSATAGDLVVVRDGVQEVETTTADGSGAWSIGLDLDPGSHTLSAIADRQGDRSEPSSPVPITIDRTPLAPVIDQPSGGATLATPTVTIAGTAEPAMQVTISELDQPIATAQSDEAGAWSAELTFEDGTHTVGATATNEFAETSAPDWVSFTIDTSIPAAKIPRILQPVPGSIHGVATLTVAGRGEPGASVRVLEGGLLLYAGTIDPAGDWSFEHAFSEQSHTLSVDSMLTTGEEIIGSGSSFTIDLTPPGAPAITAPASGPVTTDPFFVRGQAEPKSRVQIRVDGSFWTEVAADGAGAFQASLSIPNGPHTLTARAIDRAGHAGPASDAVAVTIDVDKVRPTVGHDTADNGAILMALGDAATGVAADNRALDRVEIVVRDATGAVVQSGNAACDGCEPGEATWTFDLDALPGRYRITAQAVDHRELRSVARTIAVLIV